MQIEKEEQAAAEKAVGKEEFQGEWSAPAAEFTQPEVADWSEGVSVPSVPIQQFPAGNVLFRGKFYWFKPAPNHDCYITVSCDSFAAAPAVKTGEFFSGKCLKSHTLQYIQSFANSTCVLCRGLEYSACYRGLVHRSHRSSI